MKVICKPDLNQKWEFQKHHLIIIIFLQMNTIGFKNEGLVINLIQAQNQIFAKKMQQQNILRVISQALHQSLNTYSECLNELKNSRKNCPRENTIIPSTKCVEIVIQSEELHIEGSQNKAYITDQIQSIVQTAKHSCVDSLMGNQPQSGKLQLQNIKTEPSPLEVPLIDFKISKKHKKRTTKHSTSGQSTLDEKSIKKGSLKVSEVSLMGDCDIPIFSLRDEELGSKREQLLKRRVDHWPENNRCGKHKRQLRNLE